MAGASAAKSMGYTPYWLDLMSVPGISTDVINMWNTNYSKFSRLSQRSPLFNKYVWESVTTGDRTIPGLWWALNTFAAGWPWRFLKANARDYRMSELFADLHRSLPAETPLLGSHMWNTMGAVAGDMTHVVDMMFDNWPMAFQVIEGAQHAVQSPSELERIAREQYGMAEPGETTYVVELEGGPSVDGVAITPQALDPRSPLEKFWDFLTGRDLVPDG